MSSPKPCQTRLIPDTPATQDNFSTHDTTSPHKKVAAAIAELIRSDEAGGKSIGLEGGWGSGKTTIVTLLMEDLTKNPKYKVVLFDAWAHEGDPLRRTFLENLIECLTENADHKENWIDQSLWEERKEIIAQRKEIKETSTEPQILPLGYVVIFLIAFVPIGLALLNASLKDVAFTVDPALTLSRKFIIGLLMSIAPLLAILCGLLWLRIKPFFAGKSSSSATASGLIWAMLVNKAITRETTKTNKTANPTSVEFEYYFAEVMKEALVKNDANKERKIVLVLDNLDRINPADALKILSTLQTFLNPRAKGSDAWHQRVWVLIPYDFEGLSQLWGKEKSEKREPAKAQPQAEIHQEPSPPQSVNDPNVPSFSQPIPTENLVALSFLDKSFQLRFEVPPPVLSRWRSYLMDLLKQAFPDHDKEDFHSLYRLYDWYLKEAKRLPTPRQLKLYVNQIGSLHRQWQDEISIYYQAYYVLLRRLNYDVVNSLLDKKPLPKPDIEELEEQPTFNALSALAFNVEVKEAEQIVLREKLLNAFALKQSETASPRQTTRGEGETERAETLDELYESYKDRGFWEALDKLEHWDAKSLVKFSPPELANVAYWLNNKNFLNDHLADNLISVENRTLIKSIRNRLSKEAKTVKDWGALDTHIAEGIASLCELYPEANFAKAILKRLSDDIVFKTGTDTYREPDYSTWASAINLIGGKLKQLSLEQIYSEAFIDSIKEHLFAPKTVPAIEVGILLSSLNRLSLTDDIAYKALEDLTTEGHILHHINQVRGPHNAMWMCWSIYLLFNPQLIMPATIGDSDEGYELLINLLTKYLEGREQEKNRELADQVDDYFSGYLTQFLTEHNKLENLFIIYKARPDTKDFIIECFKMVAKNEALPYVFTPEMITREWSLFDKLTEGEFNASPLDKMVKRSLEKSDFIDEVCATAFNPDFARLYSSMSLQGAENHPGFANWIRVGLQSVSKERWVAELDKPVHRHLVRLLSSVPSVAGNRPLPAYQEALLEIAKGMMASKVAPSGGATTSGGATQKIVNIVNADEAAYLIRLAGNNADQTALIERIFEAALDAKGNITKEFFDIFGKEIFQPDIIQNNSRTVFDLFIPLVSAEEPFKGLWVSKLLQNHPELIENAPFPEAVRQFRQVVRKKLVEAFANKKIILEANETKPPTVSIPLGQDGGVWVPVANPTGNDTASSLPSTRYEVDPLTAAFAITSGWFEETPDTPFSWSFYADANKSLGLTPWLASLAEIIGVLPQENSINGLG